MVIHRVISIQNIVGYHSICVYMKLYTNKIQACLVKPLYKNPRKQVAWPHLKKQKPQMTVFLS